MTYCWHAQCEIQVANGNADVSKTISYDTILNYRFLIDITVNNLPLSLKGGVPTNTNIYIINIYINMDQTVSNSNSNYNLDCFI